MSSDTLEYWYGITPEMLKSMNNNTKQSEETKIQWSMTGNPVLSGQSTPEAILTIHPDVFHGLSSSIGNSLRESSPKMSA